MVSKQRPKPDFWQVTVDRELTLEKITQSLETAQNYLLAQGKLREGALLERLDIGGGKTTIFLSGDRQVSRTLREVLGKTLRRGKVTSKPATLEKVVSA